MKNNIFIKCQQQAMTSNHVGVLKLDDGRVLLTADGFTAVVIPQEDLMLDVSRFGGLSKKSFRRHRQSTGVKADLQLQIYNPENNNKRVAV